MLAQELYAAVRSIPGIRIQSADGGPLVATGTGVLSAEQRQLLQAFLLSQRAS